MVELSKKEPNVYTSGTTSPPPPNELTWPCSCQRQAAAHDDDDDDHSDADDDDCHPKSVARCCCCRWAPPLSLVVVNSKEAGIFFFFLLLLWILRSPETWALLLTCCCCCCWLATLLLLPPLPLRCGSDSFVDVSWEWWWAVVLVVIATLCFKFSLHSTALEWSSPPPLIRSILSFLRLEPLLCERLSFNVASCPQLSRLLLTPFARVFCLQPRDKEAKEESEWFEVVAVEEEEEEALIVSILLVARMLLLSVSFIGRSNSLSFLFIAAIDFDCCKLLLFPSPSTSGTITILPPSFSSFVHLCLVAAHADLILHWGEALILRNRLTDELCCCCCVCSCSCGSCNCIHGWAMACSTVYLFTGSRVSSFRTRSLAAHHNKENIHISCFGDRLGKRMN